MSCVYTHQIIWLDAIFDFSFLLVAGLYPWTSLISHCCVPNVKIITRWAPALNAFLLFCPLIDFSNLRDDFSYISEATVGIPEGNEVVTSYHHYYYHLFGTMYRWGVIFIFFELEGRNWNCLISYSTNIISTWKSWSNLDSRLFTLKVQDANFVESSGGVIPWYSWKTFVQLI